MKSNIKSLLDAAIRDNKRHIRAYTSDGNIREYFAADFNAQDQGHTWYLTDEEIELWDNSEAESEKLINQIWELLEQYNMPVEQYLGEKVEPAY